MDTAGQMSAGYGLPTDSKARKDLPVMTGVVDYFPDALLAVAQVSVLGNEKHNPGQPLHWSKEKSTDHADCALRHLMERGKMDYSYGPNKPIRHSAAAAWRALANLQMEIESEREIKTTPAAEKDYPSRWVMQTKTGAIWTTNGIYTKAAVNNAAWLSRPVRRI